jgi:hypothetical protein
MKTFIDFIYTILIGVVVAVFVGPGPKAPEFPWTTSYVSDPTDQQKQEEQQKTEKYNQDQEQYTKSNKPYSKKVSGIAIGAALVFYGGGLWLYKRRDVIGEGLALGGVFTMIYAAIRAGIGNSKPQVFICVSALLLMLIGLVLYRSGSQLFPKKK